MKMSRFVMISLPALYFAGAASAVDEARLNTIAANLDAIRANVQRLPEAVQESIAGGTQNAASLSEAFAEIRGPLGAATPKPNPPAVTSPLFANNAQNDRKFSQFGGFTQSETSMAWCGAFGVIAYNDSGSFYETSINNPTAGVSFVGFARSINMTAIDPTFSDFGFLDPGPDPANTLLGDPVAICTSASNFYVAAVFANLVSATRGISVSRSTNGGQLFGVPITVAAKPLSTHTLDKPWIGRDPSNPLKIYVTYTDFDTSGPQFRAAIELVRSIDGGNTWIGPSVIAEVFGGDQVLGSQVAVGPAGKVYVAWELIRLDNSRAQFVTSSTNGGVTFSAPPVQVAVVDCVGSCGNGVFNGDPQLLRGFFRSAREFPSLAVDISGGANNGNVYLTWHTATATQADAGSVNDYGFADIVFSRSIDGGASWSPSVRVNGGTETNGGIDQYQPAIAVNKAGKIVDCFYDRRSNANRNFAFERWCATSTNAGGTWANTRKSLVGLFAPTPGQDILFSRFYFGDYDNVTTDGTGANTTNFAGGWSQTGEGNPDVQFDKF